LSSSAGPNIVDTPWSEGAHFKALGNEYLTWTYSYTKRAAGITSPISAGLKIGDSLESKRIEFYKQSNGEFPEMYYFNYVLWQVIYRQQSMFPDGAGTFTGYGCLVKKIQ